MCAQRWTTDDGQQQQWLEFQNLWEGGREYEGEVGALTQSMNVQLPVPTTYLVVATNKGNNGVNVIITTYYEYLVPYGIFRK